MALLLVLIGVPIGSTQAAGQTLNQVGFAFLEAGNFERAVEFFRQALEASPDDPIVWNNLGCAYYRQGKYKEAQPCFERAVQLDSSFGRAWLNLAATRLRQGQYVAAYKAYLLARKADKEYVLDHLPEAQAQGKIESYTPKLSGEGRRIKAFVDHEIELLSQ